MATFLSTVYAAILRLIPFESLKVVVIASPGFTKDTLYDYIFQQATETNNKPLLAARSKFLRVHSNTPHVHSLVEALRDPGVAKMLQGAKFAKEGLALDKWVKFGAGSPAATRQAAASWLTPRPLASSPADTRFHKMLSTDELRAWYGPQHVALAVDRGAVGTLLISDDLFRAADPEKRNRYVHMVDEVRARGGETVIFSSMHETGVQLNLLSGIAAILTYPLDIEVVEMEEREERERLEREAAEAASWGTTPAASGTTTPWRTDGI
jgi:protein pelota